MFLAKKEIFNIILLKTVCLFVISFLSSVQCAENDQKLKFYREIPELDGNVITGYSVYKEVENPTGMIIIIEGPTKDKYQNDEIVQYVSKWTKIPELAYKQGWTTIFIPYGDNLYMNDSLYQAFQKCIRYVFRKNGTGVRNYIIGGFSAGGAMAISLSEFLIRDNKKDLIPKAVFGVDPVLDLTELYNASAREVSRNYKIDSTGTTEAKSVIERLNKELGNLTTDNLVNYTENSPYTMAREDGGNAKYLRTKPVRMYHELDPMWSMKERGRPITDENGIVGCEFIYNLYSSGNKNAEVILTQNRGSRLDGTRHPHSWNIVDEKAFIDWAKLIFANNLNNK